MNFKKLNSSVLTLLLVWQNKSTVGDTVQEPGGTGQPSTWMLLLLLLLSRSSRVRLCVTL